LAGPLAGGGGQGRIDAPRGEQAPEQEAVQVLTICHSAGAHGFFQATGMGVAAGWETAVSQ